MNISDQSNGNDTVSQIASILPDPRQLSPPPRTILLRCDENVPVSESDNASAISRADVTRHLKQLGWEAYRYDMITDVITIPGHHFNVFAIEHVSLHSTQLFSGAIRSCVAVNERLFCWILG
jgi:hypothetical protein